MNKQQDFEDWLDVMPEFRCDIQDAISDSYGFEADFSKASLDKLERWLLDNFDSIPALENNSIIHDRAARYFGETMIANFGGGWELCTEPKNVYFGLPILNSLKSGIYPISPYSYITTAIDRNTGTFLSDIFQIHLEHVNE